MRRPSFDEFYGVLSVTVLEGSSTLQQSVPILIVSHGTQTPFCFYPRLKFMLGDLALMTSYRFPNHYDKQSHHPVHYPRPRPLILQANDCHPCKTQECPKEYIYVCWITRCSIHSANMTDRALPNHPNIYTGPT